MANPNIVNVTQIYGQTNFLTPASTSTLVLIANTGGSGNVFKVDQIVAANQTNTAANVTVSFYSNGAVTSGNAASGGTAFPIASNILLEDRSIVCASGTASAITFSVSYEQISS
jgi:hypothetical protein